MYSSVSNADDYFATQFNTDVWSNASIEDKEKALTQASRLLDLVRYKGAKTSPEQPHEFPRNGDATIHNRVLWACYELAFKILQGVNKTDAQQKAKRVKLGPMEIEVDSSSSKVSEEYPFLEKDIFELIKPYVLPATQTSQTLDVVRC